MRQLENETQEVINRAVNRAVKESHQMNKGSNALFGSQVLDESSRYGTPEEQEETRRRMLQEMSTIQVKKRQVEAKIREIK